MRDDIEGILEAVYSQMQKKNSLLKEFLIAEHELNSSLKTDFDNEPVRILELEQELITAINLQDYELAQLGDSFLKKTGIKIISAGADRYSDEDQRLSKIHSLRVAAQKILKEISSLRSINIELMETIKRESLHDADDLKRMSELDMAGMDYIKDKD